MVAFAIVLKREFYHCAVIAMIISSRINTGLSNCHDSCSNIPPFPQWLFSNQGMLVATTLLFALFVIAEVVGGLAGTSVNCQCN